MASQEGDGGCGAYSASFAIHPGQPPRCNQEAANCLWCGADRGGSGWFLVPQEERCATRSQGNQGKGVGHCCGSESCRGAGKGDPSTRSCSKGHAAGSKAYRTRRRGGVASSSL